jgi:hypothetical protein
MRDRRGLCSITRSSRSGAGTPFFPQAPWQLGRQVAQHHLGRKLDVVPERHVVGGGGALARQHGEPEVLHALALGEEAVAADVDAVAVVHVGLRDAAGGAGRLDDHGLDIGTRQELPGRGQARRSSARDDGDALHGQFLCSRRGLWLATRMTGAQLSPSPHDSPWSNRRWAFPERLPRIHGSEAG